MVADVSVVGYPTGVKSVGFRSQFEASRKSSHKDELWYNESLSVDDSIYIYIYIYIYIMEAFVM